MRWIIYLPFFYSSIYVIFVDCLAVTLTTDNSNITDNNSNDNYGNNNAKNNSNQHQNRTTPVKHHENHIYKKKKN